jgi:hypothetical protein
MEGLHESYERQNREQAVSEEDVLRLNVICNFIGGSPIRQRGFLILGVIPVEGALC